MHCRRDGDEMNGALRSGSFGGRCESGVDEKAKLLAPPRTVAVDGAI